LLNGSGPPSINSTPGIIDQLTRGK
jgi:hypothetical protein